MKIGNVQIQIKSYTNEIHFYHYNHFFSMPLILNADEFTLAVRAVENAPELTPGEKIAIQLSCIPGFAKQMTNEEIGRYVNPHKSEVITILRDVENTDRSIKSFGTTDFLARIALLKLNDRPTIERIMPYFLEFSNGMLDRYGQDMIAAEQPLIIPDLAMYLCLPNSAYKPYENILRSGHDDVLRTHPIRCLNAVILKTIENSKQFSNTTREWAAVVWSTDTGRKQARQILQAWWNVNKKFLQVGDFASVQPGEFPQQVDDTHKSSQTPQPRKESVKREPRHITVAAETPNSKPVEADRPQWPIWAGIIFIIFTIFGIIIHLKTQK